VVRAKGRTTQSLPQAADRLSYRRSDRWQACLAVGRRDDRRVGEANNVFRLLPRTDRQDSYGRCNMRGIGIGFVVARPRLPIDQEARLP